ncbi:MAG: iron-sulfur cluster-binding domain-containing protein [Alcanivoracaceae bacterium]|nr:iron-sulfur cluster-binding domain-containing protein [Alcanivoracaceae bacterium]
MSKVYQWLAKALVNNKSFKGFFEPLVQVFFPFWTVDAYRAKLIKIRDENKEVYSLVLKVSKYWKGFEAGQYVEISVEKNGAYMSRIFSISSAPGLYTKSGVIELTIRKQQQGCITPWLYNTLKKGQIINISAAKGHFIVNNLNRSLLLIAGGSGITPFRSIISEALRSRQAIDIHLLYYTHGIDHLFVGELQQQVEKCQGLSVSFVNSSQSGRICLAHLQQYCSDFKNRVSYICGPTGMIQATKQLLLGSNVAEEDIRYEYFGPAPVVNLDIKTSGTIVFKQSCIEVESTSKKTHSLLEIAESAGLSPTTGCRMGICHQCICQKQQGIVYNTLTKVFSDTGSEEVQICISVPVGNVTINL